MGHFHWLLIYFYYKTLINFLFTIEYYYWIFNKEKFWFEIYELWMLMTIKKFSVVQDPQTPSLERIFCFDFIIA